MRPAPIICFVDIETDGPTPGIHSMLSLGSAAYTMDGEEVSTFGANLLALDGSRADPRVEQWWSTQPEAWAAISCDRQSPVDVMRQFVAWVRQLGDQCLYAAYPVVFDGAWIDWYLRKFTDATLCYPFWPNPLFLGTGIVVATYVQTSLGLPFTLRRRDYPAEVLSPTLRPHEPISDTRSRAALFFAARKAVRSAETKSP